MYHPNTLIHIQFYYEQVKKINVFNINTYHKSPQKNKSEDIIKEGIDKWSEFMEHLKNI